MKKFLSLLLTAIMMISCVVKIADNCPAAKKIFHVGDTAWISFDKVCSHLL